MAAIKPPSFRSHATRIPATTGAVNETPNLSSLELAKVRADFRLIEFRRMILQKGYFVTWRKAMICTCFRKETDQPRLDCDVCNQSGFFYIDPIKMQAIITSMDRKKNIYDKVGEWTHGRAQITVEPQFRLGHRDSIEMADSLMPFNEWITKGNRAGIRRKLPSGQDSARYRIVNVTALMFEDVLGKPKRLEPDVDFEITAEGWIRWLAPGNKKIKEGTRLSIHYDFHPVWLVVSHPHAVRDTILGRKTGKTDAAAALPLQAEAMLDYIVEETHVPTTGDLFAEPGVLAHGGLPANAVTEDGIAVTDEGEVVTDTQ
jgi:hypothetical protein